MIKLYNTIYMYYIGISLLTEMRFASPTKKLTLSIQMETHGEEILHANYSKFRAEYDGGRNTLKKVFVSVVIST